MAQYWLDLTKPEQSVIDEFTLQVYGTEVVTLSVVDDEGTPALFIDLGTVAGSANLIWDTAGQSSGVVQVLSKLRTIDPSATYPSGIATRLTESGVAMFNGYASLPIEGLTGLQRLIRWFNSGYGRTTLSETTGDYPNSKTYHWRLLEVDGSTIRYVSWVGEYADKPVAWDGEVTDATYPAGFAAGFALRTFPGKDVYAATFSCGTDGDPAPDAAPSAGGPTIDTQPQPQTVTEPDAASFSVTATTSGGVLSYQWKDDGVNVGTNSATYNTGPTSVSMDGSQITVDVTDDNGTTASSAALLTVNAAAGIQEMYIKDGGIFVKYTPYVKVGGTFQEVDAYVLEGGTWKPVHEK